MATHNARYKAKERYAAGFTDPRGVFGTIHESYLRTPPPEFFAIPEETLINLWLAKFGEKPVTYTEVVECGDPFYQWARKRLVESQRMQNNQIPGHYTFGYTICKS